MADSSRSPFSKRNGPVVLRTILEPEDAPNTMVYLVDDNNSSVKSECVRCSCHQFMKRKPYAANWCPHTQRVYKENLDQAGSRPLGKVVEVTIMAKPRLVVYMMISMLDHGMQQVEIPFYDGHSEAIGLVMVGEGRWSLRNLYLEWIVEKSVTSLPEKCTAPHHSGHLPWKMVALPGHAVHPEGTHFDEFDVSRRDHLVALSDLLLTGSCRRCNDDNGVPDV